MNSSLPLLCTRATEVTAAPFQAPGKGNGKMERGTGKIILDLETHVVKLIGGYGEISRSPFSDSAKDILGPVGHIIPCLISPFQENQSPKCCAASLPLIPSHVLEIPLYIPVRWFLPWYVGLYGHTHITLLLLPHTMEEYKGNCKENFELPGPYMNYTIQCPCN